MSSYLSQEASWRASGEVLKADEGEGGEEGEEGFTWPRWGYGKWEGMSEPSRCHTEPRLAFTQTLYLHDHFARFPSSQECAHLAACRSPSQPSRKETSQRGSNGVRLSWPVGLGIWQHLICLAHRCNCAPSTRPVT